MRKLFYSYVIFSILVIISVILYTNKEKTEANKGGYEFAIKNYKHKIDSLSKHFNLPSSYLMALIMLESSGKAKVKPRFEKKIYKKLLLVKNGKLNKFENIKQKDLKKLSNKQIKLLSYSYGPFQIMGYKSILLKIHLDSLIGKNQLYWSIKWINYTYGDYLREKKYKHGFHIHNTGKKYPKNGKVYTYDPEYVKKGLKYIKYFKKIGN